MFHSFFPRPKLFFSSFAVWALLCVLLWFTVVQDLGRQFSVGERFGYGYPAQSVEQAQPPTAPAAPDSTDAAAPAKPSAEQLAAQTQADQAETFWLYQYQLLVYFLFIAFWLWFSPHPWSRWSVLGSALIIFTIWFQVQIDVWINAWFRSFYDLLQLALSKPGSITGSQYYAQWITFAKLALFSITLSVLVDFFTSHFVFRWRTAMNDYYMSMWERVRHIEGASQRIQEDTMRFAAIMESLGVRLINAVMTLIAFLPILWGLSTFVQELPIIGAIPQALVVVAILWSVFGTALLALTGIYLPGLQFRNQRVEAAYRKELVLGEDHDDRAQPLTVIELFHNVRKNYFRLYFHYLYFNVVRYGYLQAGVMVPYIALAPAIIAASFTWGVMQQILAAFSRVENSFQYLINSWTTIVELMSIHKRLKAFEAAINDEPLPSIDQEYLSRQGT